MAEARNEKNVKNKINNEISEFYINNTNENRISESK